MRVSVPRQYSHLDEPSVVFMAPETAADQIALQRLVELYPGAVAGFGKNPADTSQFDHLQLKLVGNQEVKKQRVFTIPPPPSRCRTCGGRGRVLAPWYLFFRKICPKCLGSGR